MRSLTNYNPPFDIFGRRDLTERLYKLTERMKSGPDKSSVLNLLNDFCKEIEAFCPQLKNKLTINHTEEINTLK